MTTHDEILTRAREILAPALEQLEAAGLELVAVVTASQSGAPAWIVGSGTMSNPERAMEMLTESFVSWRCARPRREALVWTQSETSPLTLEASDDDPWIEGLIAALKPGYFELTLSAGTVRIEQEANTAAEAKAFAEAWREALWYWNRVATRRLAQEQNERGPR